MTASVGEDIMAGVCLQVAGRTELPSSLQAGSRTSAQKQTSESPE